MLSSEEEEEGEDGADGGTKAVQSGSCAEESRLGHSEQTQVGDTPETSRTTKPCRAVPDRRSETPGRSIVSVNNRSLSADIRSK